MCARANTQTCRDVYNGGCGVGTPEKLGQSRTRVKVHYLESRAHFFLHFFDPFFKPETRFSMESFYPPPDLAIKKSPSKLVRCNFQAWTVTLFFSSRLIKNRHINENSIFIGCSVFEIWIVGVLEVINGSGKTNKTRKQWKYKRARITTVNYFAMNTRSGWRMLNCSRGNSVNIHFKYEFNWTKFLARISSASLRRCSSRRIINLYC